VFIGTYQAISHPLASLITDIDAGRLFVLKTIRDIADGDTKAGAFISGALWFNADAANRAVSRFMCLAVMVSARNTTSIYLISVQKLVRSCSAIRSACSKKQADVFMRAKPRLYPKSGPCRSILILAMMRGH
jgi:hypothetical protein